CVTAGTPSGSDRDAPGMFHSSQCRISSVPLPAAASRSRAISTKLVVPSGTSLHANGGDVSGPACEYFTGICPPSLHAVVVSDITVIGPRRPWPPPGPPGPPGAPGPCGAAGRC